LNLALGIYYYEIHQYDQAGVYLRRALRSNPHIPGALFDLGMIEWKRGEYSCAEPYLAGAVELRPSNVGFKHALEQLRAARSPDPGDGFKSPSLKASTASVAVCTAE
jgi:tetratricopeptide (TPR) repeat protein